MSDSDTTIVRGILSITVLSVCVYRFIVAGTNAKAINNAPAFWLSILGGIFLAVISSQISWLWILIIYITIPMVLMRVFKPADPSKGFFAYASIMILPIMFQLTIKVLINLVVLMHDDDISDLVGNITDP